MTHDQLVQSAYRWILKNASCGVAFHELKSMAPEIPDVIGFGGWSHSVLIECKASRSDFLADKKKPFRKNPALGMGKYRLYCCPTGMIKQEELPDKWGLIYVNENGKPRAVLNPMRQPWKDRLDKWTFSEVNENSERAMMYTALRRFQLRGYMPTIYNPEPN